MRPQFNPPHSLILISILMGLTFPFSASRAIIGGVPADQDEYAAVGSLKIEGDESVLCTATLISSRWIVTAGHCAEIFAGSEEEGSAELVGPERFEFRLGFDFQAPVFKTTLKRWVGGGAVGEEPLDVAFGELTTPVPLGELGVRVLAMDSQDWDKQDLSAPYFLIGYGSQDPFSDQVLPLTNKRQLARFHVTSTSGNALLQLFGSEKALEQYLNQFHPMSIEASSLDAIIFNGNLIPEYTVHAWDPRGRENLNDIAEPQGGWQGSCFGDSGGPLIRDVDGQLKLVGIVSQGMDRICSPLGTKFTVFGPALLEIIAYESMLDH